MRTDHPIPDLPFVDDSHLPVDDPSKVEALGRNFEEGMWGRQDPIRVSDGGGWTAFTTDPFNVTLAWCVRWHPEHGRSVVVYRDKDISTVHEAYWGPALLFRSGGYWWDGATWFRPAQVWDAVSKTYIRRPVPSASTITAGNLLRDAGDATQASGPYQIIDLDADRPPAICWVDEFAHWAQHRPGTRPLEQCLVQLRAPELMDDELVNAAEVAAIVGVPVSTLRDYLPPRGMNELPAPQGRVDGRAMWARPVAEEWGECRRTSSEGITDLISVEWQGTSRLNPGIAQTWDRFTQIFESVLWKRPGMRKRWALRWRNEKAVHDVADSLAWLVAADIDHQVPIDDLCHTLTKALVDDFAVQYRARHEPPEFYGISLPLARMLTWLVLHDPNAAAIAIAELAHDTEETMGISRWVTKRALLTALSPRGAIDFQLWREMLDRIIPDEER